MAQILLWLPNSTVYQSLSECSREVEIVPAWPVLVLACKLVSTLIWFSVLYQVKSCLKERMILALKRVIIRLVWDL